MTSMEDILKKRNVQLALEELDDDAIAELPEDKLPAFKRAIKKEYSLTDEEADVIVYKKGRGKPPVLTPPAAKEKDMSPITVREKKNSRPALDMGMLSMQVQGMKNEQDHQILDPITNQQMVNPMVLPCGHSFSDSTIVQWMSKYNSCPSCKKGVSLHEIRPNFALRDRILKGKETVQFKTVAEFDNVPASWKKELLVTASLKIPTLYTPPPTGYSESPTDSTLPTAILAVVDITSTANREAFQNAVKFILSQLNEKHYFGLVVYSKEPRLLVDMTRVTMEGRTKILSIVLDMPTMNDGCNMLDGVLGGLKVMQNFQRTFTQFHVASIALFSGNKPDKTREQIMGALELHLSKVPFDGTIYTFGFGSNIESSLLCEISRAGSGQFYYIENKQDFELGFADYLGGILSVYARSVSVTINTPNNVTLKSIYTPYFISQHKTDKSAEIYIGDVSTGEEKDILFSVELPPLPNPTDSYTIATATVTYNLASSNSLNTNKLTSACVISRTLSDSVSGDRNVEVDKHDNRITVASLFVKPEKDWKEIMRKLSSCVSFNDFYVQCLTNQVADFQKYDVNKLASFGQGHYLQRSTHALPFYFTHVKMTILETLRTFTERKTVKRQRAVKKKNVSVKESVALPPGYPRNDWLSEHVETFLEQTRSIFDCISDKCSCAEMTAGPRYSYLWADETTPEPISLPAKEYMSTLFNWIERLTKDEKLFPPRNYAAKGKSLKSKSVGDNKNFLPTVKNIFRRLLRVYAHVYYHHFEVVCERSLDTELHSTFKWFYYFAVAFELVDKKDFEPLQDLIASFN